MSWYTAKVLQITCSNKTTSTQEKSLLSSKSTTVTEDTYTMLVEVLHSGPTVPQASSASREDKGTGVKMPLASTASHEAQLPLVQVGDIITFSRARGSYGLMFAQLSIDFSKRSPIRPTDC